MYKYKSCHALGGFPQQNCDYCRRRAASQKGYIEEIRAKFGSKQVALLPSYGGEVKGEGLVRVARDLYAKRQLKL